MQSLKWTKRIMYSLIPSSFYAPKEERAIAGGAGYEIRSCMRYWPGADPSDTIMHKLMCVLLPYNERNYTYGIREQAELHARQCHMYISRYVISGVCIHTPDIT